jgi:hypothetical protein
MCFAVELKNSNKLVFVIETACVHCAVRNGCLSIIQINLCLLTLGGAPVSIPSYSA